MIPADRQPISIIIPAHNAAATLPRALDALCAQTKADDEVIVVDDGSTDDTASIAERFPVVVERCTRAAGPAAARNRGARRARHNVLLFLDADVVAHHDTIVRGMACMADPSIAAVIGSYDDAPAGRSLVSQFKNLAHHHVHHEAAGVIGTFWGACGFVRRQVFEDAGGFDEQRFAHPSIEDIELGWRITARAGVIVLDPRIQLTHLKAWTLRSLIGTDVIRRAIPWTLGELARRRLPDQLNARTSQWAAGVLALAWVTAGAFATLRPAALMAFVALTIAAVLANRRLFELFWRKGGVRLLVGGFVLQQIYYLYSATGCAIGILLHVIGVTTWVPAERIPSLAPARSRDACRR